MGGVSIRRFGHKSRANLRLRGRFTELEVLDGFGDPGHLWRLSLQPLEIEQAFK